MLIRLTYLGPRLCMDRYPMLARRDAFVPPRGQDDDRPTVGDGGKLNRCGEAARELVKWILQAWQAPDQRPRPEQLRSSPNLQAQYQRIGSCRVYYFPGLCPRENINSSSIYCPQHHRRWIKATLAARATFVRRRGNSTSITCHPRFQVNHAIRCPAKS